jgi:hypothetical protein
MTKIIRISTDGEITRLEGGDMIAASHEEFSHSSVVVCRDAPILAEFSSGLFVMVIDDFGAEDMPLNPKAWALYGRSPIFGTAFFAYDSYEGNGRPDLPDAMIDRITEPLEAWVDARVIAYMNDHADRPVMLMTRAEATGEAPA